MPNPKTRHVSVNKTTKIKYTIASIENILPIFIEQNKDMVDYNNSLKINYYFNSVKCICRSTENSSSLFYKYHNCKEKIVEEFYKNNFEDSDYFQIKEAYKKNQTITHYKSNGSHYFITIFNSNIPGNNSKEISNESKRLSPKDINLYLNEIEALDKLKILASQEIASSANGFVLADLLSQAIIIVENIKKKNDVNNILLEAIIEAKAVLDAIYDGTIDDFIIPENLHQDAPVFSGEFDALKTAILTIQNLSNTY